MMAGKKTLTKPKCFEQKKKKNRVVSTRYLFFWGRRKVFGFVVIVPGMSRTDFHSKVYFFFCYLFIQSKCKICIFYAKKK